MLLTAIIMVNHHDLDLLYVCLLLSIHSMTHRRRRGHLGSLSYLLIGSIAAGGVRSALPWSLPLAARHHGLAGDVLSSWPLITGEVEEVKVGGKEGCTCRGQAILWLVDEELKTKSSIFQYIKFQSL